MGLIKSQTNDRCWWERERSEGVTLQMFTAQCDSYQRTSAARVWVRGTGRGQVTPPPVLLLPLCLSLLPPRRAPLCWILCFTLKGKLPPSLPSFYECSVEPLPFLGCFPLCFRLHSPLSCCSCQFHSLSVLFLAFLVLVLTLLYNLS